MAIFKINRENEGCWKFVQEKQFRKRKLFSLKKGVGAAEGASFSMEDPIYFDVANLSCCQKCHPFNIYQPKISLKSHPKKNYVD